MMRALKKTPIFDNFPRSDCLGKFGHLDLGGPQLLLHTICGGTNLDTAKPNGTILDTVGLICRAAVSEEKCPWAAERGRG